MDHPLIVLLCVSSSYLLGSILAAYPVSRLFRLGDPSLAGSGNPGATNLYRLGGAKPAALTLIWDAGKGALAISLAQSISSSDQVLILAAISCVMGHILPIFHRFQGGKGVATAMGTTLIVAPATTLLLIPFWALMMAWKRLSSLASLTTAALAPWLAWWLNPEAALLFTTLSVFLFVRHRENIVRLIRRRELALNRLNRQADSRKSAASVDAPESHRR